MIAIRRYDSECKNLWNEFNKFSKNGLFMFDRNYMDYHSDRFTDYSLMFYDDKELIALLPLNKKDDVIYSHGGLTYGGFITNIKMKQSKMIECFSCLIDYCRKNGISQLVYKLVPHIYHIQAAEEDKYALFYFNARNIKVEASTVIDLSNPISMAKLRIRQAKKAINNGVEIREVKLFNAYKEYIELLNEVLNEHHNVTAVHTAEELFKLHSNFPENIHLYVAMHEGIIIAGTVVYEYENGIHTQYLAANNLGRSIGALDLVVKNVMENFHQKKFLDFGISTENMGRYLNEGLVSQKEGFGGRTVTYETWELDIKN